MFEDDDSARQLLVTILERRNYEVISAKYPTICPIYEDLTTLCPHEFACGDFLLTDNNMPALSGLDFVLLQNQRGCKGVVNNKAVLSAHWNDNELDSADQLVGRGMDSRYSPARHRRRGFPSPGCLPPRFRREASLQGV